MKRFVFVGTEAGSDRYQLQVRDCQGYWQWDGWVECVPHGTPFDTAPF